MRDKRLAQVLRKQAWEQAKEQMLFIAATYKHEDPEKHAKVMRLLKMFFDIIEKRILP